MPELIVLGPLLRIIQNGIGFRRFLELFFGGLVAGVLIGVVLHGHLSVRFLDVGLTGTFLNPEHFVIVALHSASLLSAFELTITFAWRITLSLYLYPFSNS